MEAHVPRAGVNQERIPQELHLSWLTPKEVSYLASLGLDSLSSAQGIVSETSAWIAEPNDGWRTALRTRDQSWTDTSLDSVRP